MTDTINDGGPAFPAAGMTGRGMSLRDHFAGLAMQELMSNVFAMARAGQSEAVAMVKEIPFHAYDMGEAMLIERARRQA